MNKLLCFNCNTEYCYQLIYDYDKNDRIFNDVFCPNRHMPNIIFFR